MRSHAILRTNVGLTTNVKLMVGSSYSLYLDSISSIPELDISKLKKYQFSKNNYWDELVPNFFKGIPADTAYHIKYDNDSENMSKDFGKQFDDIYNYGARNIVDNKDYTEEFEYFAPLYIHKSQLPKNFIIFRVDGPGLVTLNKENFHSEIISNLKCVKMFDLTRTSPLGEWLDLNIVKNKNFPQTPFYMDFAKLEFSSWFGLDYEDGGYSQRVKMFDDVIITEQTFHDFEKLIFDGYKNNKVIFPHIINFSFLFDDTPATPSSLRKWSINRYMGFYLDDLELVKYVSPYVLPEIKNDVVIDQYNILYSPSTINPFVDSFKPNNFPYIEIGGDFYKIEKYLEPQTSKLSKIQTSPNTYEEKPDAPYVTKYKIIANKILAGRQAEINKNLVYFDSLSSVNKLTFYDGSTFQIQDFEDADVWLIEIDGVFHNIIKSDDGEFYIKTDYAFLQYEDRFIYYINDPDPNYRKTISLKVDSENPPKKFAIYKCKFSDIKDFDTKVVTTDFSKFEYINKSKLTETDEPKMYTTNHASETYPKDLNDYKINGSVVNIPASSEYTANGETFRLIDDSLSTLWRKNSQFCKWGFLNSVSSNDYPYTLNNSISAEDHNRTTSMKSGFPSRQERNLDYFLTINSSSPDYMHHSLHVEESSSDKITFYTNFYDGGYLGLTGVSNTSAFLLGDAVLVEQTDTFSFSQYNTTGQVIKVSSNSITINIPFISTSGVNSGYLYNISRKSTITDHYIIPGFQFELDKYLGINYDNDYFGYFFSKNAYFDSGDEYVRTMKYSSFNTGDNSTPNTTLFRGLKFNIFDVDSVKISGGQIETFNIKSSNNYEEYGFAILLSKNSYSVDLIPGNLNSATVSASNNQMKWTIIDEWRNDKIYPINSIVKYFDVLYQNSVESQIIDPNINPANSSDWDLYTQPSIFWSPLFDGTNDTTMNNMYYYFNQSSPSLPPLVYHTGEYYFSKGISGNTFWQPSLIYATGSIVIYDNKIWESTTQTQKIPGSFASSQVGGGDWIILENGTTIWSIVQLWQEGKSYTDSIWDIDNSNFNKGHYVIYNDSVYYTLNTITYSTINPLQDKDNWTMIYSVATDTNKKYGPLFSNNNIIVQNNRLYMCLENNTLSTLENGINIFINKKWKNILVNIYVNDNTFADIKVNELNEKMIVNDRVANHDRDSLYNDIFSKLTAYNFSNAINDMSNKYGFSDFVKYTIINEDSSLSIYDFADLNSINNIPVLLNCQEPDEFLVKVQSIKVEPLTLSEAQIKPKRKLKSGDMTTLDQINHFSDIHLATKISQKVEQALKIPNYSGLKNVTYQRLHRQSGFYAPIFLEVQLFKSPSLTQSFGNYKFDTDLTSFGLVRERIVSKVNRQKNILKLRNNSNIKSVYPMLDEYGYHLTDFFIFKSTWDFEYHIECVEPPEVEQPSNQTPLIGSQIENNLNNNPSQL